MEASHAKIENGDVGFEVLERDGRVYLYAMDAYYDVEAELLLPENFKDLPEEKQKYWMRRRIREIAIDIKQLIRAKEKTGEAAIQRIKNAKKEIRKEARKKSQTTAKRPAIQKRLGG